MIKYPHLTKAPIAEALLDIRVQKNEEFDIDKLEAIHQEIADIFPTKKVLLSGRLEIKFDEAGGLPAEATPSESLKTGFAFINGDENRLVQVGSGGFTFNMLSPYSNWEEMRDTARKLWDLYAKESSPVKITRVALRYINKMNFPRLDADFSEFLLTSPTLPESLPQGLNNFLTRMNVPMPEMESTRVMVTFAFEGISDPEILPIILDIDAVTEKTYEVNDDAVWDVLEKLHNVKNKFFFENLTPKAIEVFK